MGIDTNANDVFGKCCGLTVSGVIRVESVQFFDHGGYTQVEANCLTRDFCHKVFEVGLHLTAYDLDEIIDMKELLKSGEIFFVKDENFSWENGHMRLFEPDLLPFKGDLEEVNACFDLNPPASKSIPDLSWANDKRPYPLEGFVSDYRAIEMGDGGFTAFVDLDTRIGFVRGFLPPIAYERYGHLLNKGEFLTVFGSLQPAVENEDDVAQIVIDAMRTL